MAGGHRKNFISWLRGASAKYSKCSFIFFTADEVGNLNLDKLGWWLRQRRLYHLFVQACRMHRPDEVLILELTHLEWPLLLFGSPVSLSAILFVQYPECSRGIKFFYKHWKTKLLLNRAPIRNLFLLNGSRSCIFLQKHFGPFPRFIPVADPAPEGRSELNFSFGADEKRRVCLFFGAISKRKGADHLLHVLRRIRAKTASHHLFVFCGRPEASYRAEFLRSIQKLRNFRPDIQLFVEMKFVSDERMRAMFERADLILMPYRRPEYSSGILALAAMFRTPVLGPSGGLLGRLIRENGLGAAVDLTPAALERSIVVDEERCRRFVAQNTIEQFVEPLLKAICDEGERLS